MSKLTQIGVEASYSMGSGGNVIEGLKNYKLGDKYLVCC